MNDNKLQAKGFVIWGICALFFLYEFFLRTVLGTYQHPLMQELQLTSFQFSLLSTTIFALIYGIMQIPVGLIADSIGLKGAMLIGVICCIASTFGFAFSYSYYAAMGCRVLMGFGASFGFICLLVSVHDWMPHRYSAIFIGLSQFIGTIGPMIAAGPLGSLSNESDINWRYAFLLIGSIGIVLAALIFLFVENNRQQSIGGVASYEPVKISTAIGELFAKIQPWYIAVLSACLYFSVEYLSENEGRSFLVLKGISLQAAGYMIAVSWMGYAIGCPLLGLLSDIFKRRKIILISCALLALTSMLMLLYLSNAAHLHIALFLLGISAGGQSIGLAIMAEQFEKQFVAVGFGLNNAMITVVAAINAPTIGLLLDQMSSAGQSITVENYQLVFNMLVITVFIALIISVFFIKETYCRSIVEGAN